MNVLAFHEDAAWQTSILLVLLFSLFPPTSILLSIVKEVKTAEQRGRRKLSAHLLILLNQGTERWQCWRGPQCQGKATWIILTVGANQNMHGRDELDSLGLKHDWNQTCLIWQYSYLHCIISKQDLRRCHCADIKKSYSAFFSNKKFLKYRFLFRNNYRFRESFKKEYRDTVSIHPIFLIT